MRLPRLSQSVIGGFTIGAELGSGGMGIVYEATGPSGQAVALKLLEVDRGSRRNEMLVSRFLREARVLRRLNHRGIVRLLGAGIVDGYVYLALERISGVSLRDIHDLRPLNLGTLLWLGAEVASSIAHLHQAGVVHRDVKPSNVLVDDDGLPRLIDFGISTYVGATQITRQNDILGTLGFIAPETLEGRSSPLTDQYSLGRMLISLATSPLRTERMAPRDRYRRILQSLRVDWGQFPDGGRWPLLQVVLQKMVTDSPERRFESMVACARALEALRETAAVSEDARQILKGMAREAKAKNPSRADSSLVTANASWFDEIVSQRDLATDVVRSRKPRVVSQGTA